jgi:Protein of unknown function (DUF1302)
MRYLAACLVLCTAPAGAVEFETHRVQGLLNLDLSYGATYRLDDADEQLIAFGNGGTGPNVNGDDGELNYNAGPVASEVRGTAELIAAFENFGVYARGAAYHDWIQDRRLDRTELTADGRDLIGSDAQLLDHYVALTVPVAGVPVHFRVGDQVVNWSTTSYLRDGLDLINAFDLAAGLQPATLVIDKRTPQGMVWAAASLTEIVAIEGYYQYDWKPLALPPVGSYFSTLDIIGGDGLNAAFLGGGRYSDQGTDLDQAFGLPAGTLGFDADFDRIPPLQTDHPDNGGQFGISMFARLLDGRATQVGLHFIRYHSRLPLLGAVTGDAAAVAATAPAVVDARAATLVDPYVSTGLTPDQALASAGRTAAAVTVSDYANAAGVLAEYPEHIDAIGASFSLSLINTGTLISGDIVHYSGFPNQIALNTVFSAALSPILFDPSIGTTPLGDYGPSEVVKGYQRSDRTQSVLSFTWVLGPRLGGQQVVAGVDFGWVHLDDVPGADDAPLQSASPHSDDAWGYRLIGSVLYTSVFGGVNLTPRFVFSRDVDGVTPAPSSTFLEGRRVLSLGLNADYLQLEADFSCFRFWGAGRDNLMRDRDYLQFRLTYSF